MSRMSEFDRTIYEHFYTREVNAMLLLRIKKWIPVLVFALCLVPIATAQRKITNHSGKPICILDITDAKGKTVGELFITGEQAVLDSLGRLTQGAGYIQGVSGEHVHVSAIIKRSKEKKGAYNFMQFLIGVNRIEWDDNGQTTSVTGIEPTIQTSHGDEWKIISDIEKPIIQDGVLLLDTAEKGRLLLKIVFGDKASVVGNSDYLFIPDLTKDSQAYLRVREYVTQVRAGADPNGKEIDLGFGTMVKLLKRDGTVPSVWLVSTSSGQAWIPEFYLTNSKEEIHFLRQKKLIPNTMTFVYKRDAVMLYGRSVFGPAVVDSQGLPASSSGSRQVAFKDNAVLFHISAIQYTWRNPMVFRSGGMTHAIAPNRLFYCTDVNDKGEGTFECIDLDTLSLCKD